MKIIIHQMKDTYEDGPSIKEIVVHDVTKIEHELNRYQHQDSIQISAASGVRVQPHIVKIEVWP